MKSRYSIKINGNNREILSVTLQDILTKIENGQNLKWALLSIYAIGDLGHNKSMLNFEEDINKSKNGVLFNWDELKALSTKFEQVIEIVLIGSQLTSTLKRYQDDVEMFSACDYTIELIDSSYWIVHALERESLEQLKDGLPGVEYLND